MPTLHRESTALSDIHNTVEYEQGAGGQLPPNISGRGGGGVNATPVFQCTPNELVLYIVHIIRI